jgi:hypothetical protein
MKAAKSVTYAFYPQDFTGYTNRIFKYLIATPAKSRVTKRHPDRQGVDVG